MSRIGKRPISVPDGVQITVKENNVACKGPKGDLSLNVDKNIKIENKDNKVLVGIIKNDRSASRLQGLFHSLVNNMLIGVSVGYEKKLEVIGVGYRSALKAKNLELNIGFSHPVLIEAPLGIEFKIQKNIITISGIDKQLVGQTAAKIREVRPPEPYKGKGIKYIDEIIKRKAGKSAKTSEGATK